MKKIVKILPFYEPRMWGGGERLENEFNYHTDVKPLGEVYNWSHYRDMRIVRYREWT